MSKISSAQMRLALQKYYVQPSCAVVFEVAQGTGHLARRHLDAVAMELWPSRGLALHGIEIKVDRGDWRRERADPEKAEQIARFCDYFWIAAPKGIVPLEELPTAWGLLELQTDGRLRQAKAAVTTPAETLTREFMAAMLRAAGRGADPAEIALAIEEKTKALEATFAERVTREARWKRDGNESDAKHWRDLLAALGEGGEEVRRYVDSSEMIAAVKLVIAAGIAKTYGGIRRLHAELAEASGRIGAALQDIPETTDEQAATADLLKSRVRQ